MKRSVLIVCAIIIGTDATLNGIYQWLFDTEENLTHVPSNPQPYILNINDTITEDGIQSIQDASNGRRDVQPDKQWRPTKPTKKTTTTTTTTTTTPSTTTEKIDHLALEFKLAINQIDEFIKRLERLNRKTVTSKIIGYSWNNAPIVAVEIQQSVHSGGTIFIDGGMNGDEWESVSLAVDTIANLESGENLAHLLWLRYAIVPLVNPDGYEKASEDEQYNLNVHTVGNCPGINIDKNFISAENKTPGKNVAACRDFGGDSMFTERESTAIRDYIKELGDVKLYINLHSQTDGLTRYSCLQNDASMAENVRYAILDNDEHMHGLQMTDYCSGVGGSPIDWAFEEMHIKHAIEMTIRKFVGSPRKMLNAYFEGIKYAILEVQLTDKDVGTAFYKECCSNSSGIVNSFNLLPLFTICYVSMSDHL